MKQGWVKKKLVDACDLFTDGNWIESKDQSLEGIRLIQTGNVGSGEYKDKKGKERFVSQETFDRLKCTEIFPGDILVSRLPEPVGRSCIIPDTDSRLITAVDCTIVRTSEELLPVFLRYFQLSNAYLKDVNSKVTGTTRSRISRKNLGLIEIPIPPLEEQKQIVAKLDQCFEAIDKAKANAAKNLENAKELFQSKLNHIFSQKGEGWVEKKLGDAYDVRDGTHDSPKYQDNGFPLITSKNLKNGLITLDKIKYISEDDYLSINKRSKVDVGDVLFAMIGTIGNPVVIRDEPDFSIKNVALFKVSKNNDSDFLRYYLEYSTRVMKYEAKGTTQKFVGLGYLRNFTIPLPDLDVQKKVVYQLNCLNKQTQSLESKYQQELNSLRELKKSILQKAFEGEL